MSSIQFPFECDVELKKKKSNVSLKKDVVGRSIETKRGVRARNKTRLDRLKVLKAQKCGKEKKNMKARKKARFTRLHLFLKDLF